MILHRFLKQMSHELVFLLTINHHYTVYRFRVSTAHMVDTIIYSRGSGSSMDFYSEGSEFLLYPKQTVLWISQL